MPAKEGYAATVIEAMNYSLLAGGKRLRPVMMLESYKLFAGADADDVTGSSYAVLTNYEQSFTYNVLSTVTTNGVTQYSYGEPSEVPLELPEPMKLEEIKLGLAKNWNDQLDTSHLLDLIKDAEAAGKKYQVVLRVSADGTEYKTYTFEPVWNEKTQTYEWPEQEISIAPAMLVSKLPEGSDASEYKTVIFNGKTYYVLNEGHEYVIEEIGGSDFHFEFTADPYHPALVDDVMTNVSFVI